MGHFVLGEKRMKTVIAALWLSVALLVQTGLAQSASPAPTVAQLLGTWQLVSVEETIAGKTQVAALFGEHPSVS